MTNAGGVAYTWDDNGNLTYDGVYTYTYSYANRLVAVIDASSSTSYGYNGLGDRVQQTVDGNTTYYSLDLAAGLTQVLDDGDNTYLYGLVRIGEERPRWRCGISMHGDALGIGAPVDGWEWSGHPGKELPAVWGGAVEFRRWGNKLLLYRGVG